MGCMPFLHIAIAIAEKDTFLCPTGGATAPFGDYLSPCEHTMCRRGWCPWTQQDASVDVGKDVFSGRAYDRKSLR
ncbi:hypothetical protein KSD_02020 [Ktedonobacter sp. SOSP1-85]|nr:hypothetical protein KSD_02020 [Ktedonobacter sp. SOSP1-85]